MKKYSHLLSILFAAMLLIFTACPKAPAKASYDMPPFAKEGVKLVYHVDYFGDEYDFIVDMKHVSKEIEFDWKMTEPVNSSGNVIMTEKALKNAKLLFNYYSDGDTLKLEEYTSVWFSRAVYDALKKGEDVTIDAGDGDEVLSFEDYEDFPVIIDKEESSLKCIYSSSDLFGWFWVLDSQKFPLILKMDIGWTITLTEIITK